MKSKGFNINPSVIVYLVGIVVFSYFYEFIKSAIGNTWLFVAAALTYIVALRLAGDFIAKKWVTYKSA